MTGARTPDVQPPLIATREARLGRSREQLLLVPGRERHELSVGGRMSGRAAWRNEQIPLIGRAAEQNEQGDALGALNVP